MSATSETERRWVVRPAMPDDFPAIIRAATDTDVHPLLAQLLYNRDIATPEKLARFFADELVSLADPFMMRGMREAVERLRQAIADNERIAIYGDYDVDGVTACALLVQVLRACGAEVVPHIPHRVDEGYGMSIAGVEKLAGEGITVIITVDCGISNVAEVAFAHTQGVDVIVTDHHRPPPMLPDALAILNPRQDGCAYPCKVLAGVGVAYTLVRGMVRGGLLAGKEMRARHMLDLVALGTVADIAPVVDENRVLVRWGLKALRSTERPGLVALMRAANIAQPEVDATGIGFGLAPRLNAAGRLDDAALAYQLLLSDDLETAQRIADELTQKNQQRREMTGAILAEAKDQVVARGLEGRKVLVLSGDNWTAGVVGLVAGRISDSYHRPTLVIERGATESKGSARCPATFNVIEALADCDDLLERYGGHRQAAGFTVRTDNIEALDERLNRNAARDLNDDDGQPDLLIDCELDINHKAAAMRVLDDLAPFGAENPSPLFASYGLQVVGVARTMGKEAEHLRLRMADPRRPNTMIDAVAFRMGHLAPRLTHGVGVDIAYNLEMHRWQESESVRAVIRAITIDDAQ